jgi:hypothetical protein
MTIITEKNHLNPRNELKITRTVTFIDDDEYNSKMRAIYNKQRKIKEQKFVDLVREYEDLYEQIQKCQLCALEVEKEYEARRLIEYATMILKPRRASVKHDIIALAKQLNKTVELYI